MKIRVSLGHGVIIKREKANIKGPVHLAHAISLFTFQTGILIVISGDTSLD